MLRLNFLIAVLPALGLLLWFRRKDQQRPEPQGLVTRVVLWGVTSTVPAVLIEAMLLRGMGPPLAQGQGGFLTAFGVAGATEESLKLSVILLYVWRKPAFDEVMDGIVYTAAASLGFAVLGLLEGIGILLISIAILFRLIRRALALDEGGVVDALPVALGPPGA